MQIPVIKYVGTIGGPVNRGLGSLPVSSPAYTGYLVNNTANGSVDLVLTGGPQPARVLTWRGTPSSDWDTTTANWLYNANPSVFNPLDFVRFDDSASGSTAVNLTTTLLPSSTTVSNNAKTYGFGGYGTLSGETSLTKDGTGTLFITNNSVNDFTGPITINAGTVRVGNGDYTGNLGSSAVVNNGTLVLNRADDVTLANSISGSGSLIKQGSAALILPVINTFSGPVMINSGTLRPANGGALGTTTGATVVANGAILDVNGLNLGAEPVTVQGAGDGNGAIINSANAQNNALRYVTLAGDTALGGSARWDIRGSTTANPATAGLSTGGNAYKLTKVGFNQVSLVGVTVDPALGAVDVQSGILSLEQATTGLGNPASTLTVFAGASLQFYGLTNQLNKVISLNYDGFTFSLINGGGANTVVGPVTMNGDGAFNIGGTSLNLAGSLTGGLLSKQGFGNLILSGTASHAGTTVVVGSLTVNGTHLAGVTNNADTFLAGNGTVSGFADVSGTVAPGGTNSIGTLTVGGLALQGGASAAFDLTNATTLGGGVNDLVVVNGDLTLNGNMVMITPQGLLKTGVPYRLFNYTGNLTVITPLSVPDVAGYSFQVDTSVAGQINLVASGGPPIWTGGSSTDSLWSDAANWNNVTLQAGNTLYFTGSNRLNNTNDTGAGTGYADVLFTADSGAFVLNGNPITLEGTVVNNSTNVQTLNLGLSYSANRTLNGLAGPLVLAGGVTNTAAGYTTLNLNGTGTLANLLGSADPAGTNVLAVAGTNANWTLVDNAAALPMSVPWALALTNGTLNFGTASSAPVLTTTTANGLPTDNQIGTAAGGVGTFNMVAGSFTTLARLNTATAANSTGMVYQVGGTLTIGSTFQGANGSNPNEQSIVRISGGTMNIGTAAAPNSGFYLASRGCGELSLSGTGRLNCGTVDIARNAAGNSYQCAGVVNLDGGILAANRVGTATSSAQTGMSFNPSATFNFNGGTLLARNNSATFFQGSTVAPIIPIKAVVKAGGAIIDTDGFSVSVLEPLVHDTALGSTPDGGLIKNGTGTLTLTAASSYSGPTLVNNGTLLVNGWIGPTTVSVESGATIGGSGLISGNVTVKPNGTATAGAANVVGTLTVVGDLTLQAGATAFMELNKAAVINDQIRASGATPTTITYAGTLALTNLSGSLAPGDTFKLFSASNYVGSFSAIIPETPGFGLGWDTNALATSGTLAVVAVAVPVPQITTFGVAGGNLTLSGTNGPANQPYVVWTSTDVALPRASWTPVATNYFDASGNFSYTNSVSSEPQRFYLISVQ
ncbi:MAG: beta strand repeat-containing protein [Verrucomicrobiota bacterium]